MIFEAHSIESASLALGVLSFTAALLAFASRLLVVASKGMLQRYFANTDRALLNERDLDRAFSGLTRPLGLTVFGLAGQLGIGLIRFPPAWEKILDAAALMFTVLAVIWLANRLIGVLGLAMRAKAAQTETRTDDILVPLVEKALRVVVFVVGVLLLAHAFHLNIGGILAGLGLGGLAFALAAKNVVENLFGSITVLVDRPFLVGDWVKIDDLEGTVEAVGFRSTRIRTFYNSVISVPNSRMITSHVDNMGARRYRRLKTLIGVEYGTPYEKVDAFCEAIRDLVRKHPKMRNEGFYVHLNGFGASSIDILVYVFFDTQDWAGELQARHEFLGQVMQLAESMQIGFAFPTRTVHLVPGEASIQG